MSLTHNRHVPLGNLHLSKLDRKTELSDLLQLWKGESENRKMHHSLGNSYGLSIYVLTLI